MKNLFIADITLSELEKDHSNNLLFREKAALESVIDSIGVDRIELPAIRNEKEDTIICRTITGLLKKASVLIEIDPYKANSELSYEAVKECKNAALGISLPVSTVQMEYSAHMKEAALIDHIGALINQAKKICANVEFTALDAARADRETLIKAVSTAVSNGASAVTLCEDAGDRLPEHISELVKSVKAEINVPVYVKLSDISGMASANAAAAVEAGADGIKASASGKNVLRIEQLAKLLSVFGHGMDVETGLDLTQLSTDIRKLTGIIANKRMNEQNNLKKDEMSSVYLDINSTMTQVRDAALMLGYDLSDEDLGKVCDSVQAVCRKKNSIEGKELDAVIASAALQVPSTFHLENFTITSSNISASMAHIRLRHKDDVIEGVAGGDGPIDAAFAAIDNSIGHHYELDDLQIQAVTEGKSALGSAVVRLRNAGQVYSGSGISTDIVGASIRAYINALNKIVYEER